MRKQEIHYKRSIGKISVRNLGSIRKYLRWLHKCRSWFANTIVSEWKLCIHAFTITHYCACTDPGIKCGKGTDLLIDPWPLHLDLLLQCLYLVVVLIDFLSLHLVLVLIALIHCLLLNKGHVHLDPMNKALAEECLFPHRHHLKEQSAC
jgi:hypothetical protein